MRRVITTLAVCAALACPRAALAVGLGPILKQGVTDGPAKAFYLTLINPLPKARSFIAYALEANKEISQPRVEIFPRVTKVGGGSKLKILVIARQIQPNESFTFRVCAEQQIQKGVIHARVCSKLTARRVPARS